LAYLRFALVGNGSVTLKDSIFQASSSLRHMVELANVLKKQDTKEDIAAMFIFTDGGLDHNYKHLCVQATLLAKFFVGWHGHQGSAPHTTPTQLDKPFRTNNAHT